MLREPLDQRLESYLAELVANADWAGEVEKAASVLGTFIGAAAKEFME